jgi:hypothetical protein
MYCKNVFHLGKDPVWTRRGDPHSEHVHQSSQQSLGAGKHTTGSSLRAQSTYIRRVQSCV